MTRTIVAPSFAFVEILTCLRMAPLAMLHSKDLYTPNQMDIAPLVMGPYYDTANLLLNQMVVAANTGLQILREFQVRIIALTTSH